MLQEVSSVQSNTSFLSTHWVPLKSVLGRERHKGGKGKDSPAGAGARFSQSVSLESSIISLSLSFLICPVEILTPLTSQVRGGVSDTLYVSAKQVLSS